MHLPKFVPPQLFDGTMKDTKSFVSSLILYIYGRKAEFPSNESKIMFALSYMQGGKAQYWKNEAINLIAARQELFKDFKDFITQMEAQFGDLSLKATAIGKLKTLCQVSSSVDEYILQFKAEASQTDLGNTVLIEYSKAGLNPVLFKSIYQLPVILETLKEWYEWAQKLDWQYRQNVRGTPNITPNIPKTIPKPSPYVPHTMSCNTLQSHVIIYMKVAPSLDHSVHVTYYLL